MSILIPIILPILAGIVLFLLPQGKQGEISDSLADPSEKKGNTIFGKRSILVGYTLLALIISIGCMIHAIAQNAAELHLFDLALSLPIYFKMDTLGKVFAVVISIVWLLSAVFAVEYMKHEEHNRRYFAFYLMVYGVLMGLSFAGNMVTFYMFFEMMTLLSMPLVLHTLTREAVMAGLKYMFYSFCGAYMVLFGLFFLCRYTNTLTFTPGGTLDPAMLQGHETLLLVCAMSMILGFSVKAGMFPMHAWLPTAHPVAPAPASAVLSGIIVKIGAFGIIRTVFYLFGADFIRGTWVQNVWMTLALITVFMGSMLAYREDVLKKRLAYSTVSQLSYILFGLSLLNITGMTGALLHVVFHAFVKTALFLGVGAIIYKTGKQRASEMTGIGKKMPVIIWCFTIASLALVGIPPTGGFLSKWYLAIGALGSGIPVFSVVGPIVLLVSALLTAGYLLPITVKGFFPGEDYDYENSENLEKQPGMKWMMIPMIILAALVLIRGMFPTEICNVLTDIASTLM